MGKFKFNGISSEDFGLVIQIPPTYSYPERDLTNNHIPGRSGDIVIDNKCYKNIERSYQIAKGFVKGSSYYANFESILDWLNSTNGSYARLEDSYDSDVYRLASFQMGGSFINYFNEAGSSEVRFNCKPQRYLKVGEDDITYNGPIVSIENPSRYLALPEITIKNINTGSFGLLMMSVLDKDGDASSSISFTDYEGDIILNSEDQTAYDLSDEDKYNVISLNGKNFPELGAGITSINFAKYTIESSGVIGSYNSLLIANQSSCLAEYKTYSAIEATNQKKFLIKSYNYIIDSHKEAYLGTSVQTMLSGKSETYIFESFNTLLSRYSKIFQFTGTLDQNASEKPDWLTFTGSTIKAAITGFFLVGTQDKRIRFIKAGNDIITTVDSNLINSIYYYKAVTSTTIPVNSVTPPSDVVGGVTTYYTIEINYTDVPSWISFTIEYDSTTNIGSPTKINYVRAASGYYWTDKTWIFGKAQWTYYTGTSYETFASLTWNTSKRAFVANEGLSLSTTMTFTYKYYNCTPTTLPEYSPVVEEQVNESTGETTEEILNAVHFTVKDLGTDLAAISIVAKEAGYYSIKLETASTQTAWVSRAAGETIALSPNLKGTDGFEVFYLESIPDYSDQIDWPEWLDPSPVKAGADPLAPTSLQFKVKVEAFYRVSSGSADESGGSAAWGTIKSIDDLIPISPIVKTSADYYYIYTVDEIPETYEKNRCFTVSSVTSETPPEWLSVEYVGVMEIGSTTPTTIKYKVGAAGYYKWDSNSVWIKKLAADIGTVLFESSGKDDSTIYYLSELPEYASFDLSDLFEITPQISSSGNPTEVEYKVLSTGYYRFNNNTDWEYITSGTVLFNSKVNESNIIYHLEELNESLDDLEIVIKPRWWML